MSRDQEDQVRDQGPKRRRGPAGGHFVRPPSDAGPPRHSAPPLGKSGPESGPESGPRTTTEDHHQDQVERFARAYRCPDCHASKRVERDSFGVWHITVVHDDTCPWLKARTA